MKREVEPSKSEVRAVRTGKLTATEGRMPWTPEEKHPLSVEGHAEYDMRQDARHLEASSALVFRVMCARLRKRHVKRGVSHGVDWQRTSKRVLHAKVSD